MNEDFLLPFSAASANTFKRPGLFVGILPSPYASSIIACVHKFELIMI